MRPSFFLPLCLVSLTLAKAIPDIKTNAKRAEDQSEQCLTKDVVVDIIDDYTYILTQPGVNPEHLNATAMKWLADDFGVYSDSILTLSNRAVSIPLISSPQIPRCH